MTSSRGSSTVMNSSTENPVHQSLIRSQVFLLASSLQSAFWSLLIESSLLRCLFLPRHHSHLPGQLWCDVGFESPLAFPSARLSFLLFPHRALFWLMSSSVTYETQIFSDVFLSFFFRSLSHLHPLHSDQTIKIWILILLLNACWLRSMHDLGHWLLIVQMYTILLNLWGSGSLLYPELYMVALDKRGRPWCY